MAARVRALAGMVTLAAMVSPYAGVAWTVVHLALEHHHHESSTATVDHHPDAAAAVHGHRHDAETPDHGHEDRKSTRLNSSHSQISYAVFCLKKKKKNKQKQ